MNRRSAHNCSEQAPLSTKRPDDPDILGRVSKPLIHIPVDEFEELHHAQISEKSISKKITKHFTADESRGKSNGVGCAYIALFESANNADESFEAETNSLSNALVNGTEDDELSSRLFVAPRVWPADRTHLAAALGVSEVPEVMRPIAEVGHEGRIDIVGIERAALAIREPLIDPVVLNRMCGKREESTDKAYAYGMSRYRACATRHGKPAMPIDPYTAALFVLEDLDLKKTYAQIKRSIGFISAVSAIVGLDFTSTDPLLVRAFKTVAKEIGKHSDGRKLPFGPRNLRAGLFYIEELSKIEPQRAATMLAVLTFGIALAERRAEIVRTNTDHIEFTAHGYRVWTYRTKTIKITDPPHITDVYRIANKAICPVAAMEQYIRVCRIGPGPLFRHILPDGTLGMGRMRSDTVLAIVREVVERGRLGDSSLYGAQSLRAGFVTAAYEAGMDLEDIKSVTTHISDQSVIRYVHRESFSRSVTAKVFS